MKPKVILAGVGAAVVIVIAWYLALFSPQSARLEAARAAKTEAVSQKSTAEAELVRLQDLAANAGVLEADRVALAAAIPDEDQLDAFILAVNDRAAKAGVSFVSISPSPPAFGAVGAGGTPAGTPGPPSIGLQIQVNGDYFQVLRFLELLRDGERIVTVDTFSLSGSGEKEMSASIGGRMFVNQPAPAPAPTAPADPAAETAAPAPTA